MKILTTNKLENEITTEVIGLVKGSSVRAKHLGKDITAGLKSIVGGEIKGYRDLQDEARKIAIDQMVKEAEKVNADAIVGFRITSSTISAGVSEILVYGTAIKIQK